MTPDQQSSQEMNVVTSNELVHVQLITIGLLLKISMTWSHGCSSWQIVNESLRIYPLTFVERRCVKDYKVPGMDYVIPAGMLVQIARYWTLKLALKRMIQNFYFCS